MTKAVKEKAEELKQAILNSEEYNNFDMYRRLLNQTPDLKEEVNKFRAANLRLQLTPLGDDRDAQQQLATEHNELLNNSVVREFLNAELIFCRMIQQLNAMVISDIDLELDFL